MRYKIIFCFLKKNGFIETNENDEEVIYCELINAVSKEDAKFKFLNKFKRLEMQPEIIELLEGTDDRI